MNIFYVPSWYPDPRRQIMNGVFLYEAVTSLAKHHPSLRIYVSLWGQGDRELSAARFRTWLGHPGLGDRSRRGRHQVAANLVELHSPTWTWRYTVRRGNIAAVLRRNRSHLAEAKAECGRIDLIHAQVSFPAGYVAMCLAAEHRIPFAVSEHMSPFPFRHFERHGAVVADVAEPLRRARCVTAVSRALAGEIRAKIGVEAVVLPNGVDETFFTPAPRTPQGFTFLTVANLEHQKGIDDLLQAIALVGPLSGVRYRLAGRGSRGGAYRALAGRLGVQDRVEWLGQLGRTEVRDAMRECDCFVLTSRHESFGVVYAEATACGKPVIATRCGGPEDIVHDGNGVLVPVGDVAGIARALTTMVGRAREYDAGAIRADFESRFASRSVSQRLVALYHELAGVC